MDTRGYCVKGLMGPLCEICDVLGNLFKISIDFSLIYHKN